MAPNLTIYCLEQITDYSEFERLCNDLMSREGYASIEPLGGFKDKGRDAVHVSKSGKTTVFAYSVREDWRAKLAEDAKKIHDHAHACDELVFITTADCRPGQRDEAVAYVKDEFGWDLHLFGVERLRLLLDTNYPDIKKLHPQLFPPEFLERPSATAVREHLFISFAPEDEVLAGWLTQRLTTEGYRVWCERFQLLGGENYPRDVDEAIKKRSFRVIALYSRNSLKHQEVMRQRSLALSVGADYADDFLIPLNIDSVMPGDLDRKTGLLQFISFDNWAHGFGQLLAKLRDVKCPQPLINGKAIATEAFLSTNTLSGEGETLVSNCLQVESMPHVIYRLRSAEAVPYYVLSRFRDVWPCRQIAPDTFLSFQKPTSIENIALRLDGEFEWSDLEAINGIRPAHVVSELLRRSLSVKCHEKGMRYCPTSRLLYFPSGPLEKTQLKYVRPDGYTSHLKAVGKRKFWRPTGSEYYIYHLAPDFSVRQDICDGFCVLVRLRIRITDTHGNVLPPGTALSRRKHLCRNWWNDDWLGRTLAVCQFLGEAGKITIGTSAGEQVIVDANPLSLHAPQGIDEKSLDRASLDERDELLGFLDNDGGEDN